MKPGAQRLGSEASILSQETPHPGTRLLTLWELEQTGQQMPEERAGRPLGDSWQKKPRITCWLWSFCSLRSREGRASFPFLVTSCIRSSHCSFTSFIWLMHWFLWRWKKAKEKDSCSETLFKLGPAVTVKSNSQTDTVISFLLPALSQGNSMLLNDMKTGVNWNFQKIRHIVLK